PEAPWPQLRLLEMATRHAGSQLVPRLCVYPEYVRDFETAQRWLDPAVLRHVLAALDGEGLARVGRWWPADHLAPPTTYAPSPSCSACVRWWTGATRRWPAAPPRSACRAASTPASPATSTSSCCRRSRRSCPASTCTPTPRWRSTRGPRRPAAASPSSFDCSS